MKRIITFTLAVEMGPRDSAENALTKSSFEMSKNMETIETSASFDEIAHFLRVLRGESRNMEEKIIARIAEVSGHEAATLLELTVVLRGPISPVEGTELEQGGMRTFHHDRCTCALHDDALGTSHHTDCPMNRQ